MDTIFKRFIVYINFDHLVLLDYLMESYTFLAYFMKILKQVDIQTKKMIQTLEALHNILIISQESNTFLYNITPLVRAIHNQISDQVVIV